MHYDYSSFGLVLLHGWQQRNWTDVGGRGLWISCCLSATFFVWGIKIKIENDCYHWFSNSLALYGMIFQWHGHHIEKSYTSVLVKIFRLLLRDLSDVW